MNYKISIFLVLFCLSANVLCLAQAQEDKHYYAAFLDGTNLTEAIDSIEARFSKFYSDEVTTSMIENHLLRQLNRGDIGQGCKVEIPYCMTCPPSFSAHNPNETLALRYHDTDGIDSFYSTYFDIETGLSDSSNIHQAGVFFEDIPLNLNKLFTFHFFCGDNISDLFIIIIDKDIDLRGALDDAREQLTLAGFNFPNETEPENNPPALPLSVFPNPVHQQLDINLQLEEPHPAGVNIKLYDFFTGRTIRTILHQQALGSGQHSFSVNTSELPNGNYLLKVEGKSVHQVKKLLILH